MSHEAQPQYIYVWGISFEDAVVANLTKRVLNAAATVAIFFAISALFSFLNSPTVATATFQFLILGLLCLIPLCGYAGAKKRSRALLSTFGCCMVVGGVLAALDTILLISAILSSSSVHWFIFISLLFNILLVCFTVSAARDSFRLASHPRVKFYNSHAQQPEHQNGSTVQPSQQEYPQAAQYPPPQRQERDPYAQQ